MNSQYHKIAFYTVQNKFEFLKLIAKLCIKERVVMFIISFPNICFLRTAAFDNIDILIVTTSAIAEGTFQRSVIVLVPDHDNNIDINAFRS